MKRFASALLGLMLLLPPAVTAAAQDPQQTLEACQSDINRSLLRERFLYEAVLFGVEKAKDADGGATRVDADGNIWTKTTGGKWMNPMDDKGLSDDDMDKKTAVDPLAPTDDNKDEPAGIHPGILQTQQATTSELIPPILQSFRAFQCRIADVCQAAGEAMVTDGTDPLKTDIAGCLPMDMPGLSACRPSETTTFMDSILLHVMATQYCNPVAKAMIAYQEAQLPFLIHYDGAHRSLRQFAGYLEPLLLSVHFPFLTPIQQTANFLKQWTRIPCFLPYCVNE